MNLLKEIQSFQKGAINGTQTLNNLVVRIFETLSKEKQDEYRLLQSALEGEISKIEKLELTTAVVAPMKSGKSTIINAIIGQEILPTRNAAMTTLPTEMLLKPDATLARLLLPEEVIAAYVQIAGLIKKRMNAEPAAIQKVLDTAPHLDKTIDVLLSGNALEMMQAQVVGNKKIMKVLELLNEVIRIASYLGIPIDKINSLSQLPRVEAPLHEKIKEQQTFGQLVVIDTPGPNEAGQEHLGAIVKKQLWRCSVVLVILDYTQLNASAGEDLKKEVDAIIKLRGKENLFVLVNKVDARGRDGDMTRENVLRYVKKLFDFSDEHFADRVIEISAKRAFVAANCQYSVSNNNCEPKAISELLQTAEPFRWENKINGIKENEIKEYIADIWLASNFSTFLEKTLSRLLADAAPMTINSAINHCLGAIERIYGDSQLRSSGIDKEVKEIESELQAIKADLASVQVKREELNMAELVKAKIESEIARISKSLDETIPEDVRKYFGKSKTKTFPTENEAVLFIRQLRVAATGELTERVQDYQNEVKSKLLEAQELILSALERNIQPIVEQVKMRIEKTFNVTIEFKKPDIGGIILIEDGFQNLSANRRAHEWMENIARYKTAHKEIWGLRRWLNDNVGANFDIDTEQVFSHFEQVKRETTDFEVNLSEFENIFSRALKTNIKITEDFADEFIKKQIDAEITLFFKDVDNYLESYLSTLNQMERDNKLNEREKIILKEQLLAIQESAIQEKHRLQRLKEQLRQLFPEV